MATTASDVISAALVVRTAFEICGAAGGLATFINHAQVDDVGALVAYIPVDQLVPTLARLTRPADWMPFYTAAVKHVIKRSNFDCCCDLIRCYGHLSGVQATTLAAELAEWGTLTQAQYLQLLAVILPSAPPTDYQAIISDYFTAGRVTEIVALTAGKNVSVRGLLTALFVYRPSVVLVQKVYAAVDSDFRDETAAYLLDRDVASFAKDSVPAEVCAYLIEVRTLFVGFAKRHELGSDLAYRVYEEWC